MEIWLEVADVVAAVGISKQAVNKRIRSFTTRAVKGKGGASGTRYQLLLSSLPEPWQAAYWQRHSALPVIWQDALDAKRAASAPEPQLPLSLPAPAFFSSSGAESSTPPVPRTAGGVASSSSSSSTALIPADDATAHLKRWQRDCLHARLALLQELDRRRMTQRSGAALASLADQARRGALPPELQALVSVALARKGSRLSRPTLGNWLAARERGLAHLAPRPKARGPRVPAWASALLHAWRRPQKPSLLWALEQIAAPGVLPAGVAVPSISAARRFLARLDAVERQRGRMGPRALKNIRPYRQRDASGLWPLDVVAMDGHTFDAEVAHPFHGQPFRPEITSAIDVATRRLVGWSVNLAESALAVLDALRHAVQSHGIPSLLYVDHGSGYHNALMEQHAIGFLARLGIEKTHSRPFNSQARGVIERLHRTVWVRLAKTLPTYLGDDMDKEARDTVYKLTRQDLKKTGQSRRLPGWPDFLAACERAVAEYNARPHTSLPLIRDPITGVKRHQSPDEVWAELVQQNPDCLVTVRDTEVADLFRPYRVGKVVRGCVRIFNNVYFAADLTAYHGESVFIGYDLHDAGRVWVRDRNLVLIAVAEVDANRADFRGQTALEHSHATRAKARVVRLERHLEEVQMELTGGRAVIEGRLATPDEVAAAAEELAVLFPPALTPDPSPSGRGENEGRRPNVFHSDLDLWRWVEDHPSQATEQDRAYLAACLEEEDFCLLVEIERQKKSRPMSRSA